jgi:NAD(P)H-hydrate epimerase
VNAQVLAERGWPCPTADEMRRVDARAIERLGLAPGLLMENAGRAAALAIRERHPASRRPLVLCGPGNNGGDGFVVARVLAAWDARIRPLVVTLGELHRRSPESRLNLDLCLKLGLEVVADPSGKDVAQLAARCDLAVDAVLGLGLSRPLEGPALDVLRAAAELPVPLVALDLPSGISGDTGEPLGVALRPDLVVCFGLPKLGLALVPLEARILVADIGLPWAAVEAVPIRAHVWTPAAARACLPARPPGAHKGTFGHVLVVGGSPGKTGAACLAAEGALRGGAGLVTLAVPRSLNPIFEEKLTEAMTLPVPEAADASFGEASLEALEQAASARECCVVGPGIGRLPETARLLARWLPDMRAPAVVDADALNAFEGRPDALRAPGARILTPHPGEMARLLGRSTAEIERDRLGAARELASIAGAVVVLKGARSVIAGPGGEARINPTGGPGLATGGTGDVLAGAIGALVAQGLPAFDAASLGVWLHGLAGEMQGRVGVAAGEVARALPDAWRRLEAAAEDAVGRDLLRPFP